MCTIAVTGHRPKKLWNDYDLVKPSTRAIGVDIGRILLEQQCTKAICGVALGIDTMFAMRAITLGIPLIAVVPFKEQANRWPKKSQTTYYDILCHAQEVVYLNELNMAYVADPSYINRLLMERNIWMVNQLVEPQDKLLAVWDGLEKGGTYSCYKYARMRIGEERIIRLNPSDYVIQKKLF